MVYEMSRRRTVATTTTITIHTTPTNPTIHALLDIGERNAGGNGSGSVALAVVATSG